MFVGIQFKKLVISLHPFQNAEDQDIQNNFIRFFYVCGTWSLVLWKENKSQVSEN
jgi:hypothetical protein